MTYTLSVTDTNIVRDADKAVIPMDEGNKDYQDYLKWLAEGNTPNPAPIVEQTVLSPQQKLENAGLTVAELKTLLGLK